VSRPIEARILGAAVTLACVVGLASLVRWLAPDAWFAWALVWLFAAKWTLILAFDLEEPRR
jgi:hypothetical protein